MTERTIPCPKCNRKFGTEQALAAHKGAVGHGRRGVRQQRRNAESDLSFAYDMVDALDLPDGAHWAMLEEMTGAEPADFAYLADRA